MDKNAIAKSNTRDLITLGLFGNSNEEWRERFRPQHYKAEEYYREPVTQILQPVISNVSKTPSRVFDIPPSIRTENKLYCYPHDEAAFKFKPELLPFSLYLQPENITIDFLNDHLVVQLEHGKSFRR